MVEVFGAKAGKGARSAVGMSFVATWRGSGGGSDFSGEGDEPKLVRKGNNSAHQVIAWRGGGVVDDDVGITRNNANRNNLFDRDKEGSV